MTRPPIDHALVFDTVYRPFGGRWVRDRSLFQSDFLAYAESMPAAMVGAAASLWRKQPERTRAVIPAMHFGLIDGQSFNCFATRSNQQYYVGIGAMVPVALLEAAAFFFAQRGFYPRIGDPEAGPLIALDGVEAPPLFQIARNRFNPRTRTDLPDHEAARLGESIDTVRMHGRHHAQDSNEPLSANQYFGQFDTLLDMLMPACVIRREHCRYVAAIVLHFFWFHEIAHVTQGHLRSLQKDDTKSLTLSEFPQSDDLAKPPDAAVRLGDLTTLAMELDADVEAILMTLGIVMLDIDIETDDFPYVDKYERVTLFVLFLIIVFRILANEESKAATTTVTHPPARIRLLNMLIHLTLITSEDDEKATDAIRLGLASARQLAEQYSFLGDVLDDGDTKAFEEEWLAVNRHRRTLTHGYDTYRYGNLRPLVVKYLDTVKFLDKTKLGPEPNWWGSKPKGSRPNQKAQ